MAYQYMPKPQIWPSVEAKFKYFRDAEAAIDVGPLVIELPAPGQRRCGTNSGYVRHMKLKTPTCQPCRTAHTAYQKAWYRRPKLRTTCGTYAGYMRHKRAEGNACEWCLKAYAEYMANYRAGKKVAA